MPVVQMPDKTFVNLPDNPTADQLASLKKLTGPAEPAAPPAPERVTSASPDWPAQVQREKQEEAASIAEFGTHAISSGWESLKGVGNVFAHPLDAAGAVPGAIGQLISKGAQAVGHPGETLEAAKKFLTTMDVGKAGDIVGTTAVGGGVGKVLGVVGDLLGPAIKKVAPGLGKKSETAQAARRLSEAGVNNIPPGARRGGLASSWEQKLSSMPWAGYFMKTARTKAGETMNTAFLNDALKHIQSSLPADAKAGHEAIKAADDAFSKAYDKQLDKMKGHLDPELTSDLEGVKQIARDTLPAANADAVVKAINAAISKFDPGVKGKAASRIEGGAKGTATTPPRAGRVTTKEVGGIPGGPIPAHEVKDAISTLRNEIDELMTSKDPGSRKAGLALIEAKSAMSRMLERLNPGEGAKLREIDRGYAKLLIARAAAVSGNESGIFTPRQGLRAVRKMDRTKGKKAFGEGEALGQQFMEDAVRVLGSSEADSGTAGRYLLVEGLLGGAAAAGAFFTAHPLLSVAAGSTPLTYSQPVIKALQRRAMRPAKTGSVKPYAVGLGATQYPGTDQTGVAQ